MHNFWKICKIDKQKVLLLYIIFIITIYDNSFYNKIFC